MPEVRCLDPPADVTADDGTTYSFTESNDTVDMTTAHAETVTALPGFELA